jgi:hypothetical protein
MAAIQDAVRRLAPRLLIVTVMLAIIAILAPLPATGETVILPYELRIYYDPRQPAYLLHDYNLRILVVEVPYGVTDCWEALPNGTVIQVCPPVKDAYVKVWYEELKTFKAARTGEDGVASIGFRLWTPRATFKVEVYSEKGTVEQRIIVTANPWLLAAYTCFAAMTSSMMLAVRRGMW